MTKRFRRFIFWVFVVFFVAASAVALLFAQGWRLDFNSLKFLKTGGIFIETSTSGAKIYVNDKYLESTAGILSYSRLVDGLIPHSYNIFVYKDGFFPWNKNVEVKDGMVIESKNIILFPLELDKIKVAILPAQTISKFSVKDNIVETINEKLKTSKTYDFDGKLLSSKKYAAATTTTEVVSPDGEKKLYAEKGQLLIDYLKDVKNEPAKSAGETDIVADYEFLPAFYGWLYDSEHVAWFSNDELTIAERDNRGGKRNSVKFYLNIDSPVFFESDHSDFYFFEKTGKESVLYKVNILGK